MLKAVRGENIHAAYVLAEDQAGHWLRLIHRGTLNESTNVGVKTSIPRVGGPDLWIVSLWCKEDEGDDVYPGSGPLEEVKPYVPLLLY